MNLRDSLLAALKTVPGTRIFHLHVLVSAPRKYSELYPFANPRPRTYLQDILVLLSEQATSGAPRVLVSAIEASLYTIPATSCAILYISKVDSTGQAAAPSPTATLVRAFLTYHADPTTRPVQAEHLWVHLFARAQNQYLFPNSSEYSGKRPLSDVKLCAWWKRIFSAAASELESRMRDKAKIRLYYILPGYTEFEASHSLSFAASAPSDSAPPAQTWVYGHPYSQSEIPLPCTNNSTADTPCLHNLGHFIPSFDDDPKSRFMDEIAYTTESDGVKSPERKRPRVAPAAQRGPSDAEISQDEPTKDGKDGNNGKEGRPQGELGKVTPDEFWERMSFRQECVAGAVTGFFTMGISTRNGSEETVSPLAPQPGQVSSQINKRVLSSLMTGHEFPDVERSVRATEILESSIKGLCEGLTHMPAPSKPAPNLAPLLRRNSREKTPERETPTPAFLAPPRTPPPRTENGRRALPEVSPNPFPEPEASLDTYYSYIYGSITVNSPLLAPKAVGLGGGAVKIDSASKVTVLTVRRKKKRCDG